MIRWAGSSIAPCKALSRSATYGKASARLIERWRLDDERPELLAEQLEWQPDSAHPPLLIDLPAWFRDVIGT